MFYITFQDPNYLNVHEKCGLCEEDQQLSKFADLELSLQDFCWTIIIKVNLYLVDVIKPYNVTWYSFIRFNTTLYEGCSLGFILVIKLRGAAMLFPSSKLGQLQNCIGTTLVILNLDERCHMFKHNWGPQGVWPSVQKWHYLSAVTVWHGCKREDAISLNVGFVDLQELWHVVQKWRGHTVLVIVAWQSRAHNEWIKAGLHL